MCDKQSEHIHKLTSIVNDEQIFGLNSTRDYLIHIPMLEKCQGVALKYKAYEKLSERCISFVVAQETNCCKVNHKIYIHFEKKVRIINDINYKLK